VAAEPARPAPAGHLRALTVSALYGLALWLLALLLRFAGESAWILTVLLYLPPLLFALPLPALIWWSWRRGARAGQAIHLLAVWALIVPLMGFVRPRAARRDPSAPVMRVLSYNVNHAYAGAGRVVAEILRFAPDVVLLSKLNTNVEPVEILLRGRYRVVESSSGFLLATHYPVIARRDPDVEVVPPDRLASARFVRWELVTALGPVAFYAVHPYSPRDGLAALVRAGGPSLLRQETAARVRQVRRIAADAAVEKVPVVIAGDTNLPAASPLLRRELAPYADGFASVGGGFGLTYPRTPFRWMRLDRIMASAQLRFASFTTGSSPASDHLAVVADLQRR
jgi:endonuclease/exonuclease/phosphatase (EEP) superfamily protein YafD